MKSRIANRFLLTAVMALVLCTVLAVSSFAAIGLTEDGKLAGLKTGESYTAASYDIVAGTSGTAQPVDKNTDFDTLGAGIWAISDGTTTEYVFVKGAESGQVSYWDTTNNAALTIAGNRTQKGLMTGLWTRGDNGSYKSAGPVTVDANGVAVVLGTAGTQNASLKETELLYGFTNAQVIPAKAFTSWTVNVALPTAYANGCSKSDVSGVVNFYVKGVGDTEATVYTSAIAGVDAGALTIAAPAEFATSDDYIVGIGFKFWANWTGSTSIYSAASLPATLQLNKGANTLGFALQYATPDVEVTGVELNKETLELTVGDTFQLEAQVLPANATEKAVTWTVEGTAVTAANGNVVAVEAGTATVTVTTANGKTDSCTVTVTAEAVLPNHEGLSICLAGTIEGLEAGKEYTIQSYDILAKTKGAKAPIDATTVIDAGLWYVSNGEKGGYVFVAGEKTGEVTYWDIANNKPFGIDNTTSTAPVAGKWTRSADGAFSNITTYTNGQGTDQSVCIWLNKNAFLTKAEGATNFEGATPKIGADNLLQESVVYYGFTNEQVVPASMVKDFTTASTTTRTGALSYNTGKTSADHKGTFTFYVYNPVTNATTTYTIDTVGDQKVFTAPAEMATAEGFFIGFAFAPYANSADDLFVCHANDLNATNGYAHFGLKAGVNKFTLKDSALPAPTGISVVDNKVTGLVDGKYYQYAPVTLGNNNELVIGDAVKLDANAKPEGLFVVRETNAAATNYTAWTEDYLYVAGSSIGNILHTQKLTGTGGANSGKEMDVPVINNITTINTTNVKQNVFVPGKWTGFLINHSLQQTYSFDPLRIGGTSGYLYTECNTYVTTTDDTAKANASKTITETLSNLYFSYGYESDEIIPMENWESYKFTTAVRQTGAKVSTGAVKTKVTIFVVNNGVVEERVALYDNTFSGSKTITTTKADFADDSGYIVGIKIQPYFAPEGTVYIGNSKTSSDINLQLIKDAYKVVLPKQPKPEGIYIEDGVVKGLDPEKTYAWAYQYIDSQSASTKIAAGSTEFSGKTGLIAIMIAGDGVTCHDSEPVLFYVPGLADGRATLGQITDNKPAYKDKVPEEWIPGTWTGSYLSWYDQNTGKSYSFLDQYAGVAAGDSRTLWLYQNTKEQAQAKLDADKLLAPPANWAQYSVTSNPALMQAAIDSHYAAADYAETLEANKAAHQQKIADAFESRYIQYAYDETEIIPVSELLEMSFDHKSRQTDFTFTSASKTVFYVMDLDGTITEYSTISDPIEVKLGVWNKVTVKPQEIENWPTEGYIVGVRFYALGDVDAASITHTKTDFRSDASNIAYSFTQHHVCMGYYYAPYTSYVILSPATAPTFEVVANAAGNGFDITITNASSANTYQYKEASEATWTTLPAGTATFTVATTGTYTVKVSGELLIGEAQADCVVDLLAPTAPELEYEINTVNDFNVTIKDYNAKLYTYEYKAEADADWTTLEANYFTVANAGKYSVRVSGAVWNGYATTDITVELGTPVAPTISVVPGLEDFAITIKNFSELYAYEYKLEDATDWTAVPAGEKTFVITEGGNYVLRAGGNVWNGYAESNFRAVEVPAAIRILTIEDKNVLTGLDAALTYEYANVNYAGIADTWTTIPAGTTYTFENAGLFAVRLAADGTTPASTPMVFNVVGPIAQRGTIINLATKNYTNGTNWNKDLRQLDVLKIVSYADRYDPQFTVGSWSGWNVGDLAYWAQDWITAIGSTNYLTHASLGAKITAGEMTQDEVKNIVTSFVFNYAYEDGEIIPFADLEKFTVRTGARQGHIYAQGDVFTKFVVYIVNDYGEIEVRELLRKADYSAVASKTTHTISAADFEDTTGYIVAMQVYPFGVVADNTTFKVSGTTGQDYEAKFIDYKVTLPRVAAPTTLTYNQDTNLVEGFDPDVEYYYAPYSINGVGETKYFTGETLQLDTGLWGVGIVSTDEEYADSLPYIVYVKGDEAARLDLYTVNPDTGYYVYKAGDIWEPGVWTGKSIATHSTFGKNGFSSLGGHHVPGSLAKALKAAIDANDAAAEATARANIVNAAHNDTQFKYALANEEIIPTNEVLDLAFTLKRRQGAIDLGEGTMAKVTFYVVDMAGNISEHVWQAETSMGETNYKIDVCGLLEGVEGYLVAFEVNPWTNVTPENIKVVGDGSTNSLAQINLTGYTIKLNPGLPELITFAAPEGGFGEISNMNSGMNYEIKTWDETTGEYSEWVAVPAGSTSFLAPAGKYLVRVAESRNYTASDAVEVVIEEVDAFRTVENETKKIHLASDFIEVKADYEIDVTTNVWVATLALDNLKITSPEATIEIIGDGYKFLLTGAQIKTDKLIHYYNFDVSLNGESRHDNNFEEIKKLAGEEFIVEFFFESTEEMPFEDAELAIFVGKEFDGSTVELRTYNERIGKLRKTSEATVEDGWAVFTKYEANAVIVNAD